MYKKGLSLMEILISTVILALVLVALSNVFIAGKTYVQQSRSRMTAAEVGKRFLDPHQMWVSQDTWSTLGNCLTPGANCVQTWTSDDGSFWTVTWSITNINLPPGPGLRRAVATIEWTLQR